MEAANRGNVTIHVIDPRPLGSVGFNGGTSARFGRRQLAGLDVQLVDLPSSSPAYASLSLAAKRERWRELTAYL